MAAFLILAACGGTGEVDTSAKSDDRPVSQSSTTEQEFIAGEEVAASTTEASALPTTTARKAADRKVTIVQSASSDAEVAELRRQLDALKAEVAVLRQRFDAQSSTTTAPQFDPGPHDRRITELERQVGVHSLNRKSLTTIWDELERLKNCMKYQTSYC